MKRIPPELHLHILEYALCDRSIFNKRIFVTWPNLALVCRSWRVRVHETAFRNTMLTQLQKGPGGKKLLEDGLAELCLSSALISIWSPCTHKLGDCIRSLALYLVPPTQLLMILQQLPLLESLTLLNELPQDWQAFDKELTTIPANYTFPSVVGLYVFQITESPKPDDSLFIFHLVSRFPSVKYLTLEVPCSPKAPRNTWPPGPKNLIAFRSHGTREVPGSTCFTTHFILSASPATLRVLKVWLLCPVEALQIARKHGRTLECLTIHPPPKWPRDRTITWKGIIRYFTNLQHLSLCSLLCQNTDIMDVIPKQNLRHLELAVNNWKSNITVVSGQALVNGIKECTLLERVTLHSVLTIREIETWLYETKVKLVRRQWDVRKSLDEPFPEYIVTGENLKYSSWEDIAEPQPCPFSTLAPRRSPLKLIENPEQITVRH